MAAITPKSSIRTAHFFETNFNSKLLIEYPPPSLFNVKARIDYYKAGKINLVYHVVCKFPLRLFVEDKGEVQLGWLLE